MRGWIPWMAAATLVCLWAGAQPSYARPRLDAVRVRVSGKPLNMKASAVTNGDEVYLPLEALHSLGLTYRLSAHEDTAAVAQKAGAPFDIAIARPGGRPMVPLSLLAARLSLTTRLEKGICSIYRPGEKVPHAQPSAGTPASDAPTRAADQVAADHAPPTALPPKPDADAKPVQTVESVDGARKRSAQPAPKDPGPVPAREPAAQKPDARKPDAHKQATAAPASVKATAAVRVQEVLFEPLDGTHGRLFVRTEGAAKGATHMLTDPTRLTLTIPNSALRTEHTEWTVEHPFVSGIHACASQDGSATEITLDLKRLVAYTLASSADGIRLNLALPRGSDRRMNEIAVVIDPGHGGKSTGCSSPGPSGHLYEKDLTLAIAKLAADELKSQGVRVILTREADQDVALQARPAMAVEHNADLFVSIHIDDCRIANSASGPTAYYHMSDADGRCLAHSIVSRVAAAAGLPSRGAMSDRSLYASGLAVLRHSSVPATLIEVGYLNNSRDRQKLIDPAVQQKIARAICDGIRGYIEGNVTEQAMAVQAIQVPELP